MRTLCCLLSIVLVLAAGSAAAAPILTAEPPLNRTLRNPIELKIVLSLAEGEAKVLDWRKPKVLIDGTDISAKAQALLEGAAAVPFQGDQFVFMDQKIEDERAEFRLYGFNAPLGPHQILVEVPRKDGGPPLRYQGQYLIVP
ncbi:hypothetical protein [Gloeobacter morelensis]|uniref:Uncharacterized protein n=1 Tax=Gloeobacter morelensis MG652769 TaxID=2781736 RepID=A0ABY3PS46_9CYAN|nr:hypothetical protein [Gloeobacter morelensis]UFP96475.1 hypothetical protein ISF26_09785 [Gloeobacter morelensis MG652769]